MNDVFKVSDALGLDPYRFSALRWLLVLRVSFQQLQLANTHEARLYHEWLVAGTKEGHTDFIIYPLGDPALVRRLDSPVVS